MCEVFDTYSYSRKSCICIDFMTLVNYALFFDSKLLIAISYAIYLLLLVLKYIISILFVSNIWNACINSKFVCKRRISEENVHTRKISKYNSIYLINHFCTKSIMFPRTLG